MINQRYPGGGTAIVTDVYVKAWLSESAFVRFRGLWDTGANSTFLAPHVIRNLALPVNGFTTIFDGSGRRESETFAAEIQFQSSINNNVSTFFLSVAATETSDFDLIIGMDIIGQGDLSISNYRTGLFSFRYPPKGPQLDLSRPFRYTDEE